MAVAHGARYGFHQMRRGRKSKISGSPMFNIRILRPRRASSSAAPRDRGWHSVRFQRGKKAILQLIWFAQNSFGRFLAVLKSIVTALGRKLRLFLRGKRLRKKSSAAAMSSGSGDWLPPQGKVPRKPRITRDGRSAPAAAGRVIDVNRFPLGIEVNGADAAFAMAVAGLL